MAKGSKAYRKLKRALDLALDRDITDLEIAAALNKPAATFSRRKDAPDFPSFEELEHIGKHLGVTPRWLQVELGYLDVDELKRRPSPRQKAP